MCFHEVNTWGQPSRRSRPSVKTGGCEKGAETAEKRGKGVRTAVAVLARVTVTTFILYCIVPGHTIIFDGFLDTFAYGGGTSLKVTA